MTITIDQLNARGQGYLPGLMGIEFLTLEPGRLTSRLAVRPELLAIPACHGRDRPGRYDLWLWDIYRSARWSAELHHDRAKEQFLHAFAYRPRREHCLCSNKGTQRTDHPGVGCYSDGRNQRENDRVVSVYVVDSVSTSIVH